MLSKGEPFLFNTFTMIDITSKEGLGISLWIMLAGYGLTLIYTAYSLYLNKKQADVSTKIDKTNELLEKILKKK